MTESNTAKLGPCCFSGYCLPNYEDKGEMKTIAGESCYVCKPKGSNDSNVIVIAPDVFSIYTNSKAYTDRLAQDGNCTALIVDYFNGTPIPSATMQPMFALMQLDRKKLGLLVWLWKMIVGVIFMLPIMIPFVIRHGKWPKKRESLENVLNELVVKGI